MYGTIARMRIKPGSEAHLAEQLRVFEEAQPAGVKANYVFRLDKEPGAYMIVSVWESKEAYDANAASPEQHARYESYTQTLTGEPEWHDGEIIYAKTF